MSNPISDLRDFLSMSPSVVFPQDVLEYLPAIEAENAKLREFTYDLLDGIIHDDGYGVDQGWMLDRLRALGIKVDE